MTRLEELVYALRGFPGREADRTVLESKRVERIHEEILKELKLWEMQ